MERLGEGKGAGCNTRFDPLVHTEILFCTCSIEIEPCLGWSLQ